MYVRLQEDFKYKYVYTYVCTVQLFIGRAPEQVDEFLAECVDPILAKNAEKVGKVAVDGVDV